MTREDIAWAKAWRCDQAWCVWGCQVVHGNWGAAAAGGALGEGLMRQAKGFGLFGVPREPCRPQAPSRKCGHAKRGEGSPQWEEGRAGSQTRRKRGRFPALEQELRQ